MENSLTRTVLIEDTRNKADKHRNVASYCDKHGIELVRQKLEVGDYALPDGNVAVDTKENLNEVATNLMNRSDASRFWREVRRAREMGVRLVILVEHGGQIKTIRDVPKWKSQYTPVTGRKLIDEMIRCEMAYGVEWQFCDKRSTGKRIMEILRTNEHID